MIKDGGTSEKEAVNMGWKGKGSCGEHGRPDLDQEDREDRREGEVKRGQDERGSGSCTGIRVSTAHLGQGGLLTNPTGSPHPCTLLTEFQSSV